jgi:hypothetical protein
MLMFGQAACLVDYHMALLADELYAWIETWNKYAQGELTRFLHNMNTIYLGEKLIITK